MELKNVSDEFLDWLNECPVQWFLIKQDEESIDYTFIKEDEDK